MRKIGGLFLISAALFLSACAAPAEATPVASPTADWQKVAQENPKLVEKIKSMCADIDAATNVDGVDAATVKRIAQEYCPR